MITDVVGNDDLLFATSVRHSTSVAQQARRYGKLVHELDEYAKEQPEWWRIRRGEAAGERITKTASNVADDLHALTSEIVERLIAREAAAA